MIASRLRFFMARQRIRSISDLQRRTGLSRNVLNRLYHEEHLDGVTLKTLERICQAFPGTELEELVEILPGPPEGSEGQDVPADQDDLTPREVEESDAAWQAYIQGVDRGETLAKVRRNLLGRRHE